MFGAALSAGAAHQVDLSKDGGNTAMVTEMRETATTTTGPLAVGTFPLSLAAHQADGSALPAWMVFDPRTGTLEGAPPSGFQGEVAVRVTARDSLGREAVQTFRIVVDQGCGDQGCGDQGCGVVPADGADRVGSAVAKAMNRPSLGEQLREMRREARLAKQAALFAVKNSDAARL